MFSNSNAYKTFRDTSQAHLDFVVVVCHAVPALKSDLALASPTVTNAPDHFKANNNSKVWLTEKAHHYQADLARVTTLAIFSFFEAYISDVFTEILKFHGGGSKLQAKARSRMDFSLNSLPAALIKEKQKLQDSYKPAKRDKYRNFSSKLDKTGFKFPSELLAVYGAKRLAEKIEDKRKAIKASEIPELIEAALLLTMSQAEKNLLERIRLNRNQVAHGRPNAFSFRQTLSDASLLRDLAARIDKQVCSHFLLVELT